VTYLHQVDRSNQPVNFFVRWLKPLQIRCACARHPLSVAASVIVRRRRVNDVAVNQTPVYFFEIVLGHLGTFSKRFEFALIFGEMIKCCIIVRDFVIIVLRARGVRTFL